MGHVKRKCLDFIKRTVDGEFPYESSFILNFFISPNVGMPVKPQLLVPTHFLLPKLPSELPGTTIKTQLSSSAREGTIHHIGCFPQLVASCRLASFDVNYLP